MLVGRSRKKLFSRPAMAWGSQYSSDRSRSTSASYHESQPVYFRHCNKGLHTRIELIFQVLYDGRASTESIDALLLVSLRLFQLLNAATDDCRQTGDARYLSGLLQHHAHHRAVS